MRPKEVGEGLSMTMTEIGNADVDIMCMCGGPILRKEKRAYGYRIVADCAECNIHFALDVMD
jgi:hypothetical protein